MSNPFGTAAMAAGYAKYRPPVHALVLERVRDFAEWDASARFARALDIGCGSGISTAAAMPYAGAVFGIEPAAAMLPFARDLVGDAAGFAAASAERLPFPDGTFDLITAAGALNYCDLARALAEARRVLRPGGQVVAYDFGPGRAEGDLWLDAFIERYPWPPSEAQELSLEQLGGNGRNFEITLTLEAEFYLEYMLTETNVAYAVRRGTAIEEIRSWCAETLGALWQGRARAVQFRGYFALL